MVGRTAPRHVHMEKAFSATHLPCVAKSIAPEALPAKHVQAADRGEPTASLGTGDIDTPEYKRFPTFTDKMLDKN